MSDFLPSGPQATRKLQDQVSRAQGDTSRRPPLTKASAGWILPNRSAPSTPSGGAHIYGSGGQVRVRTSGGQDFAIEPAPEVPFTQGAAVTSPPVFTSPSNPNKDDPDAMHAAYQALRDDCQSGLRSTLISLLNSLRNAGIIDT